MKVKEIEGLIEFIVQSGLEEVNIETDQIKISVKRNPSIVQKVAPGASFASSPNTTVSSPTIPSTEAPSKASLRPSSEPTAPNYVTIKSPMIGTFYRAANPESPPFVKEGDSISQGQTVCVIEAMKLFNEIEAEISGTVVKMLVEDASPVEYDQPLFLVEPA